MVEIKRYKVLIVENKKSALAFDIGTLFKTFSDFDLLSTNDEDNAIAIISKEKPVLLIQDIDNAGDASGWNLIRVVRKFNEQIKIIALIDSNSIPVSSLDLIKHPAMAAILPKPVDPANFTHIISGILDPNNAYMKYAVEPGVDKASKLKPEALKVIHKISNALTVSRVFCEKYSLDYQKRNTKGKSDKELLADAVKIMDSTVDNIDKVFVVIEKIRDL